jgi:hypothetical protein
VVENIIVETMKETPECAVDLDEPVKEFPIELRYPGYHVSFSINIRPFDVDIYNVDSMFYEDRSGESGVPEKQMYDDDTAILLRVLKPVIDFLAAQRSFLSITYSSDFAGGNRTLYTSDDPHVVEQADELAWLKRRYGEQLQREETVFGGELSRAVSGALGSRPRGSSCPTKPRRKRQTK